MPAMRSALLAFVLAAACSAEPTTAVSYLTPAAHLARASLALRGIRPSVSELVAVTRHPAQVARFIDRYLDSPEFGATIRELHNEVLLLPPQLTNFTPPPAPPLAD